MAWIAEATVRMENTLPFRKAETVSSRVQAMLSSGMYLLISTYSFVASTASGESSVGFISSSNGAFPLE